MVTNINSTDLDFNSIRTSLKTFFAQSDQFKDYDFEASGLSNILDVLAYNTHYNALTANMAINESFLETAQLRSSVVTHALSLGYFPRSRVSAKATVNLKLDLNSYVGTPPPSITLPADTLFNTTIDGKSYTFRTIEALSATNDGFNIYNFQTSTENRDILIYEGIKKTKTFYVSDASEKQIYIIPDNNIDTETVSVNVYTSPTSSVGVTYFDLTDAIRIESDSRYYLLKESPNGYYELQFGFNNALGDQPDAGEKIIVTYLNVSGSEANGAKTFSPQNTISVNGQPFNLITTRVAASSGGAEKQSIDSIRLNAPLGYASQRRAVTKNDYRTLIQTQNPNLIDVIAWGGEENTPIDYGKVYISLVYPDGLTEAEKSAIKAGITNNIATPLGAMSIDPVYVEPVETYMGLTHTFDFNPNLTSITAQAQASRIELLMSDYFTQNLGKFSKSFRRSTLLSIIDNYDQSILSSAMDVKIIQRFVPTLGEKKSYTISYPVAIAEPDDKLRRIISSRFSYNNKVCRITNKFSSNILQIIDESFNVIERNIGTYNSSTGIITLDDFAPVSIFSSVNYIKLITTPANQADIKPLRNYVLKLDEAETKSIPNIDYQVTRVTI